MDPSAWIVMIASIVLLWGTATWAMVRSLRIEDRKLSLLDVQGEIDTYSPKALEELREWIEAHPDDPYAGEARARYNECVDILGRIDTPFYDWTPEQRRALAKM